MAGGSLFATPFGTEYLRFCATGAIADARAVHARRDEMVAAAGPLREASFLLRTVWGAPGGLDPARSASCVPARLPTWPSGTSTTRRAGPPTTRFARWR